MFGSYEEPKLTPSDSAVSGTTETHPAYAQIGAIRVSGHAFLYGSDFVHNGYVTITIRKSELNRSLHRDWAFGREELIEVALSEAQWANFVSCMNSGLGTQCTLQFIRPQDDKIRVGNIPQIPTIKPRQTQFKEEMDVKLENVRRDIDGLANLITNSNVTEKAKKLFLNQLRAIKQELGTNLEFVAKSFSEHVEDVTEHAKTEVNAYIVSRIHAAGLAAIGAQAGPIQLEGDVIDVPLLQSKEGE